MYADGWDMRPIISIEEAAILMLSFNPSDTNLANLERKYTGSLTHAKAAIDMLCDACLRGDLSYSLKPKIVFDAETQQFNTVNERYELDCDMTANADKIMVKTAEVASYFIESNLKAEAFFVYRSDAIFERFGRPSINNDSEIIIEPEREAEAAADAQISISFALQTANYVIETLQRKPNLLNNARNSKEAILDVLDAYNLGLEENGKRPLSANMIKSIALVVNWDNKGGKPPNR